MKSGQPITDEPIKVFALEAQNGYSEEKLLTARRGRGRPRLGVDKKSVDSVRLGPSLKSEAEQRALADGISVSEVIRRALKQYLHSASTLSRQRLNPCLQFRHPYRWTLERSSDSSGIPRVRAANNALVLTVRSNGSISSVPTIRRYHFDT
jgi:Ribbon-helix-helix protein, copG family